MAFILIITLTKTESSFYFPENIYRLNWFYHFLTALYSSPFSSFRQHYITQNLVKNFSTLHNFSHFVKRNISRCRGQKMPYELFRTSYSHNSTQYSHIVKLTLHFYAHIGAGHLAIKPLLCEHIVVSGF